jgi:nicotinate-nucleotide adenylyltransferase
MIRALYGGSFDPVHAGHLAVIDTLLARGLAAVVHVVPAGQSPLKPTPPRASDADRLELVRLALAGRERVVLDGREVRDGGVHYTVDTLAALSGEHPDDRWRLVVGADHVPQFARWREPERLLELAEVVVIARGPVALEEPLTRRTLVVEDFAHPAEATDLRRRLAAGERPGPELMPPRVADLIAARGLYGWPHPGEDA